MEQNPVQSPVVASNVNSNKTMWYVIGGVVALVVIGGAVKNMFMSSFGPERMMERAAGVDADHHLDGPTTYNYKSGDGSVTVGASAKLPDGWPSDVATYPGATIQYSAASNPTTGKSGSMVASLSSDGVDKVVAYFKSTLPSQGWKIEQTMQASGSTIIAATKDTRTLGMSVTSDGKGGTVITMGLGEK